MKDDNQFVMSEKKQDISPLEQYIFPIDELVTLIFDDPTQILRVGSVSTFLAFVEDLLIKTKMVSNKQDSGLFTMKFAEWLLVMYSKEFGIRFNKRKNDYELTNRRRYNPAPQGVIQHVEFSPSSFGSYTIVKMEIARDVFIITGPANWKKTGPFEIAPETPLYSKSIEHLGTTGEVLDLDRAIFPPSEEVAMTLRELRLKEGEDVDQIDHDATARYWSLELFCEREFKKVRDVLVGILFPDWNLEYDVVFNINHTQRYVDGWPLDLFYDFFAEVYFELVAQHFDEDCARVWRSLELCRVASTKRQSHDILLRLLDKVEGPRGLIFQKVPRGSQEFKKAYRAVWLFEMSKKLKMDRYAGVPFFPPESYVVQCIVSESEERFNVGKNTYPSRGGVEYDLEPGRLSEFRVLREKLYQ